MFCFELPIGWNELGVIATVLAVIVALCANRKATKQLKSALAMQEQSKNVGLYKERIEIMQAIQSNSAVFEPSLKILFNDEICNCYKAWRKHLSEKASAEHDLGTFFALSRTPDGEGGHINDVQNTIHQYEIDMSRPDCPRKIIDEYKNFCDGHVFWDKVGEDEKLTPYNHAEISDRIAKAAIDAKKEQNQTLQLIERFIAKSIQKIDEKSSEK